MVDGPEDSRSGEDVASDSSAVNASGKHEVSLAEIQGSGESCSIVERNEASEQFWADDEEDPEEATPKCSDGGGGNIFMGKAVEESCPLCHRPLEDKPLICIGCTKRLREWMPGGVEELALRGRWADPRTADDDRDGTSRDSLYFCPVGAEHRLLFGRFSNLPRFAQCRLTSSSDDSEPDFETDRQLERCRRLKEWRTAKKRPLRKLRCSTLSCHSCRNADGIAALLRRPIDSNTSRKLCHKCKKITPYDANK